MSALGLSVDTHARDFQTQGGLETKVAGKPAPGTVAAPFVPHLASLMQPRVSASIQPSIFIETANRAITPLVGQSAGFATTFRVRDSGKI